MSMARIGEKSATARFGKHGATIVRMAEPFNAGPPPQLLRQSYITPADLFFVRNHGPVPIVDPATYQLSVDGLVRKPLRLTIDHLRKDFARVTVIAAIQCAGNRRKEMTQVARIEGQVPWDTEAVSNGEWSGVRLRHVLLAAGLEPEATHVAFAGLDRIDVEGKTTEFGGSISKEKAMSPEVILAYEMNGQPLPPVHGYPLRVVVPGYIGARSVKWLSQIVVRSSPSDNYFQAEAYKLLPPWSSAEIVESSKGRTLEEQRINSVICLPRHGARVADDVVVVKGYAIAGGDREVERVELSIDGGKTWMAASLPERRPRWAWCFWEAHLKLRPGSHTIAVRAWDSAGETQPMRTRDVWNAKGYMNNAWHRIDIKIDDAEW
jgi:sulfite oxidase